VEPDGPAGGLAAACSAVERLLPGTVLDGWLPLVQGAVGHVAGMRSPDGTELVVKVYRPGADARLRTELAALHLARPVAPVPTVVLHGEAADPSASGYLLMTRLPGARWADVRPRLDAATSSALVVETGRLLRRLHAVRGVRFGDLLAPGFTSAWERVAERRESVLAQFLGSGGSARTAGRVTRFVDAARSAIESCSAPALWHHDVIDGNLLLTGAFLHDIGKIHELTFARSFAYTTRGQLLGHMIIELEMLHQKIAQVPNFPEEYKTLIEHLIISHHGKYEFGSPKMPMFPEALMLHYLDDLDSKMESMRTQFLREPDSEWTAYNPSLERPLLNSKKFLEKVMANEAGGQSNESVAAAASAGATGEEL